MTTDMGEPAATVLNAPRLELRDLRVRFPSTPRSRAETSNGSNRPSISLSVDQGQSLVVLGSRQDELTLLLRTIVGLRRPASGDVLLDGRRAFHGTRGVQMVARDSAIPLGSNATEALKGRARLLGIDPGSIEKVTSELLRKIGLLTRASRSIRDLTQAEQHRLRLAFGLLAEPLLLCLDLPGSAFDIEGEGSLQAHWSDLLARGGSVLWVSTSFGEREHATNRCARFQDGRMLWVRESRTIQTARPTFEIRLEGSVDATLQRLTTETFECVTGSSFDRNRLVIRFANEDQVDDFVRFCSEHRLRLRGLARQRASLDQLVPPIPESKS